MTYSVTRLGAYDALKMVMSNQGVCLLLALYGVAVAVIVDRTLMVE